MKTAAIIAEYNPFHSGHAWQIQKTREAGATHIVCVMSGNTVQRGDIAVFDKHLRAKAALYGGADLVLELPCPYSCSAAQDFAKGAVSIISRLKAVDMLSFGSECGDIERLKSASRLSPDDATFKILLNDGMTYPKAFSKAVEKSVYADIFSMPNNVLGVEYIRRLEQMCPEIEPFTGQRTVPHDSGETADGFASASKIREMLAAGESAHEYVPEIERESVASSIFNAEQAIMFKLFSMTKEDFYDLPYCTENHSLADRLISALKTSRGLESLFQQTKTKWLTMARIRRAVIHAALGIKASDLEGEPPFARILAINDRGAEILSRSKKADGETIAVSESLAKLSKLSERAEKFAYFDELSSRLQKMGSADGLWCDGENEYCRKFTN